MHSIQQRVFLKLYRGTVSIQNCTKQFIPNISNTETFQSLVFVKGSIFENLLLAIKGLLQLVGIAVQEDELVEEFGPTLRWALSLQLGHQSGHCLVGMEWSNELHLQLPSLKLLDQKVWSFEKRRWAFVVTVVAAESWLAIYLTLSLAA